MDKKSPSHETFPLNLGDQSFVIQFIVIPAGGACVASQFIVITNGGAIVTDQNVVVPSDDATVPNKHIVIAIHSAEGASEYALCGNHDEAVARTNSRDEVFVMAEYVSKIWSKLVTSTRTSFE
jgi:hypothetical protein